MNAPIVIFAFNRPDSLLRLKKSLERDNLYASSLKYVFIDGCRNESDKENVNKVIDIAHQMTDNVTISPVNKGLAKSVISGITKIIEIYGKVIVLEDDLVCSANFLEFMNQALDAYENDKNIISICGYGLKIKRPKAYIGDVYLSNRASSWGWGTWKDRWKNIDWEIKDWNTLSTDKAQQVAFNRGGSDMFQMLKGYMEGKNQSWAIRFCYNQFKQHKYSVCPFLSKIDNKGFGDNATNCKQKYSRFKTEMDVTYNKIFNLPNKLDYNENIAKQLRYYHSLALRIYSKIRKYINL